MGCEMVDHTKKIEKNEFCPFSDFLNGERVNLSHGWISSPQEGIFRLDQMDGD